MNDAKKILTLAKQLLSKKGAWRKGWFFGYRRRDGKLLKEGPKGQVNCWCALGAITEASSRLRANHDARLVARQVLRDAVAPGGAGIGEWNDTRSNRQQVIAGFNKALKALK